MWYELLFFFYCMFTYNFQQGKYILKKNDYSVIDYTEGFLQCIFPVYSLNFPAGPELPL